MSKTPTLTEEEIKLAYRAYCTKMFVMDIDDFIDAEHLSYDEFKERLTSK